MGFGNAKAERPYTRTIKWKSGDDQFETYNADTKKNEPVEIDWFTVLEELTSVSGYNENSNKGIWSNEVLELGQKIEVRVGNDIVTSGSWKEIKAEVTAMGGKFTNVVIALLPSGEIIRILLAGSGCTGWIGKKFSPMSLQCGVKFNGSQEGKKGNVTYNIPTFVKRELSSEETESAMDAWKTVEAWLKDRGQERTEEHDQSHGYDEHDQGEPSDANAAFQEAGMTEDPPF